MYTAKPERCLRRWSYLSTKFHDHSLGGCRQLTALSNAIRRDRYAIVEGAVAGTWGKSDGLEMSARETRGRDIPWVW